MTPLPIGILQVGEGEPTILAIVVVVILLGIGFLVAQAAWDRIRGTYRGSATYQLVRGEEGLGLAPVDDRVGDRAVSLDDADMLSLVTAVEGRNEMRLHTVLGPGGEETAFEDWEPEDGAPRAIVVEDSNGLFEVNVAGIVEAQPPLDAAVERDLLGVLEAVLAGQRAGSSPTGPGSESGASPSSQGRT